MLVVFAIWFHERTKQKEDKKINLKSIPTQNKRKSVDNSRGVLSTDIPYCAVCHHCAWCRVDEAIKQAKKHNTNNNTSNKINNNTKQS